MAKKKTKVNFIPLIQKCSYFHPNEKKICRNCNNTMKYKDGYYMIYESNGKKYGFFVDTIK